MTDEAGQAQPRVLIVDDSRMVRASIAKQIRGSFDVREEADGEAGWQALLVDPTIEVVISDIGMPKLDGFGLLERIRASRVARVHELPVLVISGDEENEAREKARQLGANDFITKGIGSVELLARLQSLLTLASARRQLEESREALASHSPVDPVSGLVTPAYLQWHGNQEMSLARRRQAAISAMAIQIDGFEAIVERYGGHIAKLITRKLSKILSTKVRKEDTVAQLAEAQFAVLSPSTDIDGCGAFALRLRRTIDKMVMTYREERIRITISVGLANSGTDSIESLSRLIGLAVQRAASGSSAGGDRVISHDGEVDATTIGRFARLPISIDHVLVQLRSGAGEEVWARNRDVIDTLLPLFELIESRLGCGIPVESLRQLAQTPPGNQPAERPESSNN